MADERDERVVDVADQWRLTLEVEGGWPGAYPPPLPDELEAELQPRLGTSVEFIPSAIDDGVERRLYRFHTAPHLGIDQVLGAIVAMLEERLARTSMGLAIGVHLRHVDGREARRTTHPPSQAGR